MGGSDGDDLGERLTVIWADLHCRPSGVVPEVGDFTPYIEGEGIKKSFRNYIRVDGLGRASYIAGNEFWGVQEPGIVTGELKEKESEPEPPLWKLIWDYVIHPGHKAPEKVWPTPEALWLEDFKAILTQKGLKLGETVVVIDEKVEKSYFEALCELGIKCDYHLWLPRGQGISDG